jgi:hypothetical protein
MQKIFIIGFLILAFFSFDDVLGQELRENLIPYRKGNKWGYVEKSTKEIIIAPKFDEAKRFINRNLAIIRLDNLWGLIDTNGEVIIPPKYDDISDFKSTKFHFLGKTNGIYVLIDKEGKEYATNYKSISLLGNNLLEVDNGNGIGILDEDFSVLLPCNYDNISSINNFLQFIYIQKNGKWGVFDTYSKTLMIECIYDGVYDYSMSTKKAIIPFQKKKLWGYIDLDKSKQNSPKFKYKMAFPYFNAKTSIVMLKNKFYLLSINGSTIGKLGYDEYVYSINTPHNTFILGYKNKKVLNFGVLDSIGNPIIPFVYSLIKHTYNDNLFIVIDTNKKSFLIDYNNRVLSKEYLNIQEFPTQHSDFLITINEKGRGLIYKNGEEILPAIYKHIFIPSENRIPVINLENKLGYVDYNGNTIIPFMYDNLTISSVSFIHGFALVRKNGKYGYVSANGDEFFED